jgi:hypothetical protein
MESIRLSAAGRRLAVAATMALAAGTGAASAQGAGSMTFFVTSVGNGAAAGDYGGLVGADARCQALAAAAGAGARTWRAYLSTAPNFQGGALVHARDRIGGGPWRNFDGDEVASDLADLHANGVAPALMLTELGGAVPLAEHDILTGTDADGTAIEEFPGNPAAPPPNCLNWTSNAPDAYGWVGHEDWIAGQSWIDQHEVLCDEAGLASTAGSGRLYCFALSIFGDGFESGDTTRWSLSQP